MEVVDSVYSTGAEKPKQVPVVEQIDHRTASSFSPFGLGGSNNSQHAVSPPPQPVANKVNNLKAGRYSAVLTIFTAEVDVELSEKLSVELRRSTKKNPPRELKYEFIYVCHPLISVIMGINLLFRWGRTSIMRRKGAAFSRMRRVVFSKACTLTWMGECVSGVHTLSLTLV